MPIRPLPPQPSHPIAAPPQPAPASGRHLAVASLPAALALALGACSAAGGATIEPATPCALVLTTAADWPTVQALSAAIAQRAGLPVTHLLPITPRMFALELDAAGAIACERATARLAADPTFARSVEPDRRRTLPPRPSASSAL